MKVKSESELALSCPTLRDPMDCSLLGSSVHGIFQARILEWGAIEEVIYFKQLHAFKNQFKLKVKLYEKFCNSRHSVFMCDIFINLFKS